MPSYSLPQIPSPTQENLQAVCLSLKTTVDFLLGRTAEIPEDLLIDILKRWTRSGDVTAKRAALKEFVLQPQTTTGEITGISKWGEFRINNSGTAYLGRGSTVWGQILDSGATLRGGTWSFTSGSNQVIPRGFYIATPVAGAVRLDINDSGWQTGNVNFHGGLLASDGTNVRLFETAASTATVDYLQVGP